jgi:HEAT repeat protein
MNRNRVSTTVAVAIALLTVSGCDQEERGPLLAGGREVSSWVAELHDKKPQTRRQAVLKLGNVGESDPAVVEALAEALDDTNAQVRRAAIQAIAKLTKPSDKILTQLKLMVENDRDTVVRDYAKKAVLHFNPAE